MADEWTEVQLIGAPEQPEPLPEHIVVFRLKDGRRLALDPWVDITPLESARIAMFLTWAGWCGSDVGHWREYIKRYDLERHFREIPS